MKSPPSTFPFFFFNDTATTEIYTLSLHDALPILSVDHDGPGHRNRIAERYRERLRGSPAFLHQSGGEDRKSTRLNSSHVRISYAVFCLKKKKKKIGTQQQLRTQTGK